MKGLSVFVSAVILVAVTISLLGVFGPWANNLVGDLGDTADEDTSEMLESQEGNLEVKDENIDRFAGEVNITLENTGDVELESVSVDLLCEDGDVVRKSLGENIERGDVITKSVQGDGITGCDVQKLKVLDENLGGVSTDIGEPGRSKYYVQPIIFDPTDYPEEDIETGFFLIDVNSEVNEPISSVEGLKQVSPGGLLTEKDIAAGLGILSFGDGRIMSADYFWDLDLLSEGEFANETFQIHTVSKTDDFSEDNVADISDSINSLTSEGENWAATLPGNNFGYINSTHVTIDTKKNTSIVKMGSGISNFTDDDVEVVLDFPEPTSSELDNSFGFGSKVIDGDKVFRSIILENSTDGIEAYHKIWDKDTGNEIAGFKSLERAFVTVEMAGDRLVVSTAEKEVLEKGKKGDSKVLVFDASDGLKNIFQEDPINTYTGHSGPVTSIEYMGNGLVATGETANTWILSQFLDSKDGIVKGDGEVHLWNVDSADGREDASNIYDPGLGVNGTIKIDRLDDKRISLVAVNLDRGGFLFDVKTLERQTVNIFEAADKRDADLVLEHREDPLFWPGLISVDTL